jgi:transketolase
MRKIIIKTLVELAERDSRIVLVTGDLGYTVIEPFRDAFPERFFNVGVAEQNAVGIATGLAKNGYIPFVYSIATFATLRPFEFIKNGPVLHNLPVRIFGVGGGFEYDHGGVTHYALEDIGVLRTQPSMQVVVPADDLQARNYLLSTWNAVGPVYYRLSKTNGVIIPALGGPFEASGAHFIRQGSDIVLLFMGSIVQEVVDAAEILAEKGVSAAVVAVSEIQPCPVALKAVLGKFRYGVTVEAHYCNGGLGSLVCEVVAENALKCRIRRCAVREVPAGRTGTEKEMNKMFGIDASCIAEAAARLLENTVRTDE